MCGIVGYIGKAKAVDAIMNGLTRLEYRGYDSAGIAVPEKGGIEIVRAVGRLDNLKEALHGKEIHATMGIGHTRWATHGKPSENNAHPHKAGRIAMVHNGIIENYRALKMELSSGNCVYQSDTDTEVLACLIESYYKDNLYQAVRQAVAKVKGSYAIAVISEDEPDKIVVARKDSPLVIGVSEHEYIAASDISAALDITKDFIMLSEGELAVLSKDGVAVYDMSGKPVRKDIRHISWDASMAEKGGYPDFMIKEIHEQPAALVDTMRGKITDGRVTLDELAGFDPLGIDRVIFVACGTSWHSSLIGKFYFEKFASLPAETDIASEFNQRTMPLSDRVLVICISQSGETADTKLALRRAKERGACTAAICNVVGSAIAGEAQYCLHTQAGPEISVASTKAFSTQTVILFLFALWLGEKRGGLRFEDLTLYLSELLKIPEKIKELFNYEEQISVIAETYKKTEHFLYIGRYYNYPIALEGALKLKEISYIHAEGYPSGELKHGPIALLAENFPVMVFAPDGTVKDKVFSSIQEVKARGAKVIAVLSDAARGEELDADSRLYVPACPEEFSVFLTVVVAQLFAYYTAKALGKDVDKPRNLAKSVTVE